MTHLTACAGIDQGISVRAGSTVFAADDPATLHRFVRKHPVALRKTLSSTNVIESAFSIVETVCRNVKRWRGGDHVERWVGSGLLVAESKFRRVKGCQEIPQLMDAMINSASRKGIAKKAGAA